MAAMQKFSFNFPKSSVPCPTNFEWIFHNQQLTNMVMMQNFEVISDKFNIDRICT